MYNIKLGKCNEEITTYGKRVKSDSMLWRKLHQNKTNAKICISLMIFKLFFLNLCYNFFISIILGI